MGQRPASQLNNEINQPPAGPVMTGRLASPRF
jgi:hypothetical protein